MALGKMEQNKKTIALVLGTRPEIIKLAPLITAFKKSKLLAPIVISSGQHQEMAKQTFAVFNIIPDFDLHLMQQNQSLNILLGLLLQKLEPILIEINPYCVIVQGDTTTALGAALTAFHLHIPI